MDSQGDRSDSFELTEAAFRGPDVFEKVGRPCYVNVNLDAITHNINVLRKCCKNKEIGTSILKVLQFTYPADPTKKQGVIGVVKSAGCGHGSVMVSKHLKKIGVERLAVATVHEGIHLRRNRVTGPIHILGNCQAWEMVLCLNHQLIPTLSEERPIRAMAGLLKENRDLIHNCDNKQSMPEGAVHIKVDSGMCRNGCQPKDLPFLVKLCDDHNVPLEGIFTHLADPWDNRDFTLKQMETYLSAIEPYRSRPGLMFHTSGTAAILRGYGTDLNLIRPGNFMYGLPPASADAEFLSFGLQPALSLKAMTTLVKECEKGAKVGYSCTYQCQSSEFIAVIPLGYGDGYSRGLSSNGYVIRDRTGELCPVVGRVSMDAITVRLSSAVEENETFTIISADHNPKTSASGIAARLDTISEEITTSLSPRFPRLYTTNGMCCLVDAIDPSIY